MLRIGAAGFGDGLHLLPRGLYGRSSGCGLEFGLDIIQLAIDLFDIRFHHFTVRAVTGDLIRRGRRLPHQLGIGDCFSTLLADVH